MTFRILTVCTGNICRSPLAEQLLRRDVAGIDGVAVSSAGTGALVGSGMPDEALRLAASLGVEDADRHVSRQLAGGHIAESDLILAMARDHRRAVVELSPAATRKTFTVRELARIVADMSEADLRAGVPDNASLDDALRSALAIAAATRGMIAPPAAQADLDVIDPYRRSMAVYEESGAQIAPAVASVAEFLRRATRYAVHR